MAHATERLFSHQKPRGVRVPILCRSDQREEAAQGRGQKMMVSFLTIGQLICIESTQRQFESVSEDAAEHLSNKDNSDPDSSDCGGDGLSLSLKASPERDSDYSHLVSSSQG